MTINPLVAGRLDGQPDAWSGVWIAEDIELIAQGVKNGSWIDTSLGVVGAGLDALAMVSDPVGVLLQYGVAWIIEHVKPLSEALDWLAGDPAQIAGHAQTWRNVAASLHDDAADLERAVRWDVADWSGAAGPAYRTWAKQQSDAIGALAKASETMAALTEGAGALIAAVRILVRDAIATCISRLVVYAAEEVASLGVATRWSPSRSPPSSPPGRPRSPAGSKACSPACAGWNPLSAASANSSANSRRFSTGYGARGQTGRAVFAGEPLTGSPVTARRS